MGAQVEYEVKYHGFFPDIIGDVTFNIKSLKEPLKPIDLTTRGKLLGIEVHCSQIKGDYE
jgi:RNA 3'-terminal phosphate cyclase